MSSTGILANSEFHLGKNWQHSSALWWRSLFVFLFLLRSSGPAVQTRLLAGQIKLGLTEVSWKIAVNFSGYKILRQWYLTERRHLWCSYFLGLRFFFLLSQAWCLQFFWTRAVVLQIYCYLQLKFPAGILSLCLALPIFKKTLWHVEWSTSGKNTTTVFWRIFERHT